jgi:hypothetical protein
MFPARIAAAVMTSRLMLASLLRSQTYSALPFDFVPA